MTRAKGFPFETLLTNVSQKKAGKIRLSEG